LPNIHSILDRLAQAKWFLTIDLKSGFWLQREMNHISAELATFFIMYLDDGIVFSETFEEHIRHLREALTKLYRMNLLAGLPKCMFAWPELNYTGFTVGRHWHEARPNKS
jgi:hypothetical protein